VIHLEVPAKPVPCGLKALCAARIDLEFSVKSSKSGFMRVPKVCAKPEIY